METKKSQIGLEWMKRYTGLLFILLLAVSPVISSAASANIIINPGFESGTAPWSFHTNGAGTFLNNAPGAGSTYSGHLTISSPGTNVQFSQMGLVLDPNTKYSLSFKAYSNTGHDLSVSLLKNVDPYSNYGLSNKVFNLGTSWGSYSVQFTTTGFSTTVSDGRLMFWLASYDAAADQYYFDDVVLTKVSQDIPVPPPPSSSILSNPGFESGITPWSFYTNGEGIFLNNVPGAGSPHAGHIAISAQGTNVQLSQAGLVLEPNTKYSLTFKAYSNTGHDLSVSLLKNIAPYTNYGLSNKVFNLGTSWGTYSVQFTTTGFSTTVKDGRLMFWLASYDAAADQYYLDDVVLTKISQDVPVPPSTQVPPTIITQPASKTITAGQTAIFSVVATGTAPLTYQWQKNDVNINGATGTSYTTPSATISDNGATYGVIVTNAKGSVTSNQATLTVNGASSNARQLVIIDQNYIHNTNTMAFSFFGLGNTPANLVSPINYAGGTIYQRLQVITKPSNKGVTYQLCLFQDKIVAEKHACTNYIAFTSTGTYYASQPMNTLYQYYNIVWSRSLLDRMLVVKDVNGMPVDTRYRPPFGPFEGGNLNLYYPMQVRYTAIMVPPGGGQPVWP